MRPCKSPVALRVLVALALVTAAPLCAAQAPADRSSVPPGDSRSGAAPADGAIKGGSVAPDFTTRPPSARDVARCNQLAGRLRDQCLRDLNAGAGGTLPPQGAPPSPAQRDPSEPPPQNPRGSR